MTTRDYAAQRLAQLRAEFAAGQTQVAQVEQRAQDLRHTLLRISGAIDVLEELLAQDAAGASAPRTLEVIDGHVAG